MDKRSLHFNGKTLQGILTVPGDKSISHRAIILGSIAEGTTMVENFLQSEDCMRTIQAFRNLGVNIVQQGQNLKISSSGMKGLVEPNSPLYFGNSGTTARLMLGVLGGQTFHTTVYGDESLTNRPMDRVAIPLQRMGVSIDGRKNGKYLPFSVRGGDLQAIHYSLPVKSAQVKSAILLAALYANGVTVIREPVQTRDHTEKMLQSFGVDIKLNNREITLTPPEKLHSSTITVPGDISSAAFFIAAAAAIPNSNVTIKQVGLNHTRSGIIDILQQMGANLEIDYLDTVNHEPVGDVTVSASSLRGITIEGDMIPRLIDELPIIALLATQAEGTTIIRDAEELRVKETDRIQAVVEGLSSIGASITATDDGMIIEGKTNLIGGQVKSFHDHRIGMMAAIASFLTDEAVVVDDLSSIAISYPRFFDDLNQLIKKN
ncbi:3-phosphoshikimate 1-carboxyvinyltransferase [Oceanobacillus halotolerans]|uniref:3-phosphoshikimate 1-carboxyvinyltransferase n=1 Tax=Oceanobacillus halotolerans TaxID=2663380 RepID=UPI0013DB953D|nr:3-phosphoshikimate 1-carboxyvinyltransferase [Oceanobacillus halotolerans]